MFIQSEPTPNPNSIKFLPNQAVTGNSTTYDFADIEASTISPLGLALFQIGGVERVFLGMDFITVTKNIDAEWKHVQPMIQATIMDHFMTGLPVLSEAYQADQNAATENAGSASEDDEVVAEIKALIDSRVRPAVAQDGGDIIFHSFEPDTGLVKLSLLGACAGCPASTMTLKQGVENMLRAYIPEVSAVEAVL